MKSKSILALASLFLLAISCKKINRPETFVLGQEAFGGIVIQTDDEGSDEYNQKLSHARAKSVVDYLVSQGIKKTRLSSEGKGANYPISAEKKDLNRRVEIRLSRN